MSTDDANPHCNTEGNDENAQPTNEKAGSTGPAAPSVEYQFSTHNTPRTAAAVSATDIDRVYAALVDSLDGAMCYRASADLDVEGLTDHQIGSAIAELAAAEDCPLDIERWSGAETTPTRWQVECRGLLADGGQEPVKNREWIAEQLATVGAVVTWDRFTVGRRDGEQVVTVYGWIDRDDEYKGFVWTRFYPDSEWFEYTTSSAQWSEYLHAEWFDESLDEHTECRRVEDAFSIENCIELTDQQELATDGGLPEHIGRVNGLGDGPAWYRCQECGATGDEPEEIDHHERCPGEREVATDGDDSDGPEPAGLREGETPDENAHARRNAAQLSQMDGTGGLSDE